MLLSKQTIMAWSSRFPPAFVGDGNPLAVVWPLQSHRPFPSAVPDVPPPSLPHCEERDPVLADRLGFLPSPGSRHDQTVATVWVPLLVAAPPSRGPEAGSASRPVPACHRVSASLRSRFRSGS